MRHFSDEDAIKYMTHYIAKEKASGHFEPFPKVTEVRYDGTYDGERETCGGCTLGDGQDCVPPTHYVDKFTVICTDEYKGAKPDLRYSYVFMGWADGSCSNAYPDTNGVHHYKYVRGRSNFTSQSLYEFYIERTLI